MITKAAVLVETNRPLELWDLEIPELRKGQVLVRVKAAGVCRSQLNEWHGRRGPDRYLPHTLGHEGSGEVIAIGDGVTKVAEGDFVVMTWLKGTGMDAGGSSYGSAAGPVNTGPVSTFQEMAVVSENRLVKIDRISDNVAALLGCAVPTGCGIVMNEMRPKPAQSIAIWGAGGVGLCSVMAAALMKCEPIIVVDISREKLGLAMECGATHAVDASNVDPVATVREVSSDGVDFGVESSGIIEAMENGFMSTKPDGTFVVAGNPEKGSRMKLDPFDLISGRKLHGSWGGGTDPDVDVPRYRNLYESGDLSLDKLVGKSFHLFAINEALEHADSGASGRVIVETS